jgi:hypothetical protein
MESIAAAAPSEIEGVRYFAIQQLVVRAARAVET